MGDKKTQYLIKIANSIIVSVLIVFFTLLYFDKNRGTISEIVTASSTFGLFVVSVYGIVFQLGSYIYNNQKNHNHKEKNNAKQS